MLTIRNYLPGLVIGAVVIAVLFFLGLDEFGGADEKLSKLYDAKKYQEFYDTLRAKGPKYFDSEKYTVRRILAFKQIQKANCVKDRVQILEKLAALERESDFANMLEVGKSCGGADREIDEFLALAKDPEGTKFLRMTALEHIATAKSLLSADTGAASFDDTVLMSAWRHLLAAEKEQTVALAPSQDEIKRVGSLLNNRRMTYIKRLITSGRGDDAAVFIKAHYGSEEPSNSPEIGKLSGQIRSARVAKEAALARAKVAERKRRGVSVGMTQQEVRESSWGRPDKINRTVTQGGVHEQWVYSGGYLYFEDGVLTTIQN